VVSGHLRGAKFKNFAAPVFDVISPDASTSAQWGIMDIYHQRIILNSLLLLFIIAAAFYAWRKSKADPLRFHSKQVYNERTKLLATFINNIGTASVVGGILLSIFHGQFLNNEWNTESTLAIWSLWLGLACHLLAQWVLRNLRE